MVKKSLIYLASPHSHQSSAIRNDRYLAVLNCNIWLVKNNYFVYSPIVSSHHIGMELIKDNEWLDNHAGWNHWKEFDELMITKCDELWVLMIPGTEDSVGVKAEVEIAFGQNKNVMTIHEVRYPFRNDGNYNYSVLNFRGWDNESGC